jgi:ADP-heptose:LPS heptosyltransferase
MTAAILVIKLGALGDFVQALGPFAAIRRHHEGARIVLLTTAPYVDFARASPYFDEVWLDDRPKAHDIAGWLALRRRLRGGGFARVYDLQTSDRSSFYYRLFWPGPWPEWSGIARGCSHSHANPRRDSMHTLERQAEQLGMAGIAAPPPPDLSWAPADVARFALPARYALLVPGGAAHRPDKRWPADRYGTLAVRLADAGLVPVVLGAAAEAELAEAVRAACPAAISLAGRTALLDLVGLARGAACAVGNDTGPMHLIAAAGCRSAVLYSAASDPALCGQRGPAVIILRRPDLAGLTVDEVAATLGLA